MKTKINCRDVIHIDKENGDIICETQGCTEIKDDNLTETEKKRLEYISTHEMNFNKGADFVKMYTDIVYKLAQKLSPKEFSVAISLCKYVEFETCILRNGYGKGKHDMDLHEISDELNIDYTRMSRIMSSLIAKGVIGEFKTGNLKTTKIIKKYLVNPYIYTNGAHPEIDVIEHFFNKTGWKQFISDTE